MVPIVEQRVGPTIGDSPTEPTITRQKKTRPPQRMRDVRAYQWTGPGSNRRHQDFQSCALPTELPVQNA
jgi:hypothetical protein